MSYEEKLFQTMALTTNDVVSRNFHIFDLRSVATAKRARRMTTNAKHERAI